MIMKKIILCLICSFLVSQMAFADKEIAVTIDDLPFVGTANTPSKLKREQQRFLMIMQALIDNNVPATGFVISGTIEKEQNLLLDRFKEHGFIIANHTHTHKSLNQVSADRYIRDIDRAHEILTPLMEGHPKFFRYPYLAEASGAKREKVRNHLIDKGYIISPVTVDSKDFKFNSQLFRVRYRARPSYLPSLRKRYLSHMWRATVRAEKKAEQQGIENPKQILLLHANLLNAHFMGDIIKMYKDKGYKFISLEEAMKAPNIAKINAVTD